MTFKMNGAPYPTNRKGKTNPNSEGNTDLKNGRSKSSAFQNKGYYDSLEHHGNIGGPRDHGPLKGRLGRWLMGRKKHTTSDGTTVITDKKGKVVKTKTAKGTKTKYKKGNRPDAV